MICLQNSSTDIFTLLQGFWRGMLPSLIMVSNPTVNYMLYENFTTTLMNFRRRRAGTTHPTNSAQTLRRSIHAVHWEAGDPHDGVKNGESFRQDHTKAPLTCESSFGEAKQRNVHRGTPTQTTASHGNAPSNHPDTAGVYPQTKVYLD